MIELPEGWEETSLGTICSAIQYGLTASAKARESGPRFLRITDIQDGKVDWKSVPTCDLSKIDLDKYRLGTGDIVFARSGATTGKSFLIRDCPVDTVFASYLIRVRALEGAAVPAFLARYFQSPAYWEFITDNIAGNAQPNCNGSKLAALPIPLPPLPEQKRIVAKVEALLAEVNAARERLERVPAILKRFRQSVLAAACSGTLTEDWRRANQAAAVTALTSDLEADDQENSDTFSPILPETWGWVAVDDACESVIDYRGRTPPTDESGNIPHVRTTNVRGGRIDWNTESFVTQAVYKEYMTRGIPRPGDVIFTMEAPLGDAAVVDRDEPFSLAQRLLLLRGRNDLIRGDYLAVALESHPVSQAIEHRATGSTVLGIAYKRFKFVKIPIPPLAEQEEIVGRVRTLLAITGTIEHSVEAALPPTRSIVQSILAKAFRGELVLTEAELARAEGREYETAAQLLARVQAEREAPKPVKEAKKRKVKEATSGAPKRAKRRAVTG
jgi:type I restriction enzyme S subunit